MPRKRSSQPTEVEMEILRVIWERGPSSVREIHQALRGSRDVGPTTTLKMVQVMFDKGLLVRDESRRPQVYRPAQPQEKTQLAVLDDLIQRVFGGSAAKLVLRAASAKRISAKELDQIRKMIDEATSEGGRK
jgi:BlaI family transcriptional regulator, penicillinase repressor